MYVMGLCEAWCVAIVRDRWREFTTSHPLFMQEIDRMMIVVLQRVCRCACSLPSMPTFNICSTQPDVPVKNPENVIGEGDQPGNLVIFWTPMSKIEQNAPDFKYIVSWQQYNVTGAQYNSVTIETPDVWHYVVQVRSSRE